MILILYKIIMEYNILLIPKNKDDERTINPSLKSILIMVIIGYGFSQIGQLLSPVHVCNVVTNRFFNTNLFKNTFFIAKPCLFIAAGAILSASVVWWIM